ncbi:hypothetical protein L484_015450 [Morus notabilis]|uniref:Uncharacterized protein n=1 Tax=Morus notabilis TaxID=981085 RepID=W9RYC0_9ROSA|nr:hypothetical protein L484_015450 [Morus notabilis]
MVDERQTQIHSPIQAPLPPAVDEVAILETCLSHQKERDLKSIDDRGGSNSPSSGSQSGFQHTRLFPTL